MRERIKERNRKKEVDSQMQHWGKLTDRTGGIQRRRNREGTLSLGEYCHTYHDTAHLF